MYKHLKIAYIGGGSKQWARVFMSDLAVSDGLSGQIALYDNYGTTKFAPYASSNMETNSKYYYSFGLSFYKLTEGTPVSFTSTVTLVENGVATNTVEVPVYGEYTLPGGTIANIPEGYHMYDLGPYVGGPLATALTFTIEGGETVGEVTPLQDAHRYYDDVFCMEIGTYEGVAKFAQEIRLNAPAATIAITTESMICDDQSCMPPQDSELKLTIGEPTAASNEGPKDAAGDKGLWALIIEAILWGFAALLTPCVFPMVPMTVSYFLKGEGGVARGRLRAALYGLFIVGLYTLPIAAITAGETMFSEAMSSRFLFCLLSSASIALPTSSS